MPALHCLIRDYLQNISENLAQDQTLFSLGMIVVYQHVGIVRDNVMLGKK